MPEDLKSLRIDRSAARAVGRRKSRFRRRWGVVAAVLVLAVLGRLAYGLWFAPVEVQITKVVQTAAESVGDPEVVLNASGYIVAARKIEVASKVVGRVAWIGVDKGDRVQEGQILVRLEDDEYQAQLQQARGQLASLEARLQELLNGSRPEEVAAAQAALDEARAQWENARVTLERTRSLVREGVLSRQALDDAEARCQSQQARVAALEKNYELVRIGPRVEQIQAARGQVEQARGAVRFYETQLANTVIRAPVSGTILERAVEKGEFVTTSFVGERGAKGYVVSLADLNDLEVELDINQNDFARLKPQHRATVTTDAYPDRKYDGVIRQISPEANRQKATVQVKVKILNPDELLRPEMNASVAFVQPSAPSAAAGRPLTMIPASALKAGAVFIVRDGRVQRRPVRTGARRGQYLVVEAGLAGGETIVVQAPDQLKDGARVRIAGG